MGTRVWLAVVLAFASVQMVLMPVRTDAAAASPSGTVSLATAALADPCGERVRKGWGWYKCTFVDHFNGSALDTRYWVAMHGQATGAACAANSPRTIGVSGGSLRLSVIPAGDGLSCPVRNGEQAPYVAGWVSTYGKWSQQYGRFEARMKSAIAQGSGPHEAFWLWPDVRYDTSGLLWPAAGEIDIVENYASNPNLAVPFLHYTANDNGGAVPGLNTAWDCLAPRGQWHTYVLEWTSTKLTISVDGQTCLVNTAGASSFRKRFIMSFTQSLTHTGANVYDGRTPLPVTLEVDYVKVWS